MLATEFFFSQTFYLRTPDKHTKSQQKSTHAKYEKIQVFFLPSFFPVDAMFFMQISCIGRIFYKKNFIFNRIQHFNNNRRMNVSAR